MLTYPFTPRVNHIVMLIVVCLIAVAILATCGGCDSLRKAPSEPQKQVAYKTHSNAVAANAIGAEPGSPLTGQMVDGTATALKYTGMPADPVIVDYDATSSQAAADAAERPTAADVFGEASEKAEGYLGLGLDLALLLGAGGIGFGGKKLTDWISLARDKNAALREIIQGNELFKRQIAAIASDELTPEAAIAAFKSSQKQAQNPSGATGVLVTQLKHSA